MSTHLSCFNLGVMSVTEFVNLLQNLLRDRQSRLELFCKKGALRNFAKFTGKHLCQSLNFNKVAG